MKRYDFELIPVPSEALVAVGIVPGVTAEAFVDGKRMQDACFDRTKLPDSVFEQADVRNYSTDEQDWSEHSDPVLSM